MVCSIFSVFVQHRYLMYFSDILNITVLASPQPVYKGLLPPSCPHAPTHIQNYDCNFNLDPVLTRKFVVSLSPRLLFPVLLLLMSLTRREKKFSRVIDGQMSVFVTPKVWLCVLVWRFVDIWDSQNHEPWCSFLVLCTHIHTHTHNL